MPRRKTARRGKDAPEPAAPEPSAESRPGGRGVWSGSLSFGLVSVPVELHSAQRAGGVPLRMLSADGTPLERRYVCPEENRTLERDEIARGFPVGNDEYVLVTDAELAALAPRRSRDIEITRFVAREAIDPSYFERAYLLVPGGEQTKAYSLLAETMERTGRAAIAGFVMRDKAHSVAIFADGGVLRAETLREGDELRSAEVVELPKAKRVEAARVGKLERAIAALAKRTLDESELEDDGPERLLALARRKQQRGEGVIEAPEGAAADEAASGELVDLMELLKARLARSERARPKRASARKASGGRKPAAKRRKTG